MSYILLEDGGRIQLEDGTGFLLLEQATVSVPGIVYGEVRSEVTVHGEVQSSVGVVVGRIESEATVS